MSVPKKHTIWGKVHYRGEIYGVLQGFHLNRVIFQAYEHYCKDRDCIRSSAPWSAMNVQWSIENEKLYLTNIGKTGLLTTLFGTERILADWVGDMSLLVKHRKVCRSYESRGTYIYEMETIRLTFDQGRIIGEQNKSELYRNRELRNYTAMRPAYGAIHIDSNALLEYLSDTAQATSGDQIFPYVSDLIECMTQKSAKHKPIKREDIKRLFENSSLGILSSAKGYDMAEILGSLADSLTDGIPKPKGCLVHLNICKGYSIENARHLLDDLAGKLGFDKSDISHPTMPYGDHFISSISPSDNMEKGEVWIRVLLSV